MDDNSSKTEPQEPKNDAEQSAQPARRPWVKPTFERESLNAALTSSPKLYAFDGSSNYS